MNDAIIAPVIAPNPCIIIDRLFRFSLMSSSEFLETWTVSASVTVSFHAIVIYDTRTHAATKYLPWVTPNYIINAIDIAHNSVINIICPFLFDPKILILSLINPYTILNDYGRAIIPISPATSEGSNFISSLNKFSKLKSKNYLNPYVKLQINRIIMKDVSYS